jgi:hypothetical protein
MQPTSKTSQPMSTVNHSTPEFTITNVNLSKPSYGHQCQAPCQSEGPKIKPKTQSKFSARTTDARMAIQLQSPLNNAAVFCHDENIDPRIGSTLNPIPLTYSAHAPSQPSPFKLIQPNLVQSAIPEEQHTPNKPGTLSKQLSFHTAQSKLIISQQCSTLGVPKIYSQSAHPKSFLFDSMQASQVQKSNPE